MEEHDIDALIAWKYDTYVDGLDTESDEEGRTQKRSEWQGQGVYSGLFAIRLQYDVIQIIYMNFKNNTNAKN